MKSSLTVATIVLLSSITYANPPSNLQAGASGEGLDCSANASQKDARCFGAKGDNQSDNVAAFNAWFAALASQPGSVGILPPGEYRVNSAPNGAPTLKNAKNVTIIANDAVIFQSQAVPPGGNPPQAHFATILVIGASGLTWTGGRIIGHNDYTGRNQGSMHAAANLEIMDSEHVIIKGARFDNWGFAGVLLYNSNYVAIEDNQFVGPGSTTLFGGGGLIPPGGNYNFGIALEYTDAREDPSKYNHDIKITGNSILNGGTGILSGDTYRNVLIAHNTIKRSVGQHGMYIDGLMDSTVADNIVEDPYYNGIKTNPIYAGRNVLFSNNTVTITTPGMGNGACLLIVQGDHGETSRNQNVTVQGGTYSGCSGYGIYAYVVDGIKITGAKISNIVGPGIVVYDFTAGIIANNTVTTTSQAAIVARPSANGHVEVVSNTITNPNTIHSGKPGFDSAITITPWVKGRPVTANVSGTRLSRGNGRPDFAVYMSDTAVQGTSLGSTVPNHFDNLDTSDHRRPRP